ncbi:putative tRNA (uracil-O(2)-)-methyltransferase [Smittium culicis]|uniref:tRNA (uracil-O(2)-)-methyltransferase n=1 Tax=Smittium culicis TaxID=133412 RepID=A0A1R1YLI3_9FUNG|nr:putative tRNA (uracil-O(2)-)-methyltransferase [Smittium culicis]
MEDYSVKVNLSNEKKRLDAYSLYSPNFYFESFQKTSDSSPEWRTLIEANISCFTTKEFKKIIDLWINEPSRVYPPIENSVVLSKSTSENIDQVLILRKLIPKRKKVDLELSENITINSTDTVNKSQYDEIYANLKEKYASKLVENWQEKTDPSKFIFEDLAIASWLISIWSSYKKKPSFVDLGCGNGLLVYILNCEGFVGYGIDQSSRKIWSLFDPKPSLIASTITPFSTVLKNDWIIGNHADELVPW